MSEDSITNLLSLNKFDFMNVSNNNIQLSNYKGKK